MVLWRLGDRGKLANESSDLIRASLRPMVSREQWDDEVEHLLDSPF